VPLPPLRSERPRKSPSRASGVWDPRQRTGGANRRPSRDVARRARRRNHIHRHRSRLRDNGVGETLLADLLKSDRSRSCSHEMRLRHRSPRPGASERRQDWSRRSVRAQLEASSGGSAPTTSISTSFTMRASTDSRRCTLGRAGRFRVEGKVRELGVALGPAIRGLKKDSTPVRELRSFRCRPCSMCSSRSPGSRSRRNPMSRGRGSVSFACSARVRHPFRQDHA